MTRPVFVGNGRMLVGINQFGMVHDFYYPYVGLENHVTGPSLRHKIGVWVDGRFSWLDDGSWSIKMDYEEDAMVGFSVAINHDLQISLEFHDFVDSTSNVFGRNIHVVNQADHEREVRVFMHQVFQIAESARGDTALFIPDDNAILDYKGNRAFVIYGESGSDKTPFDQYSIGNFGIEGKEGTYKDAEDGELEENAVEHGHIDSALRFKLNIRAKSSDRIHYWIAAASTNVDALELHEEIRSDGLQARYEKTQRYWYKWLMKSAKVQKQLPKQDLVHFKKSLFIIKSHIDRRGAVIASGDSQMLNYARDYYSYCWPRDSAYAILPLLRCGYLKEAENWFEFARDVLTDGGYLMHKYLPDRSIGSSWHPYVHEHHKELPIQEDELAITIYLLGEYLKAGGDHEFVERLYKTLIKPAANFMEEYIDAPTGLPHASYDLWEERFQTTTYSTATVYAAMKTAADLADQYGHADDAVRWETVANEVKINARDTLYNQDRKFFYRGYLLGENGMMDFDPIIDIASLFGAFHFGLYDENDPYLIDAVKTFTDTLVDKSPSGGVPRYEYDQYNRSEPAHLGNPWFVATLWYAQYQATQGDSESVDKWLAWTRSKMLKSSVLPEQIHPETSAHVSVSPLIWSHAEYVNTVLARTKLK